MTEEEFWAALAPVPPAPPPMYRLYHDEKGSPLFFSMEDLPGTYIDVDRETFISAPTQIKVVDGKIKYIQTFLYPKLVPSDHGKSCHPADVCIIVNEEDPHVKWSLKTYVKSESY